MPKAPPLLPGDRIGVIAPASAPRAPEHLKAGLARLRAFGYVVETGRPDYTATGYLAGNDQARLAELNDMLRREDVRAIFCVRGGFGSLRLLPEVDYDAMRSNPKLLVGYSDITALHAAIYARAGVPGLAGAMVASDFYDPDESSLDHVFRLLRGESPVSLTDPPGSRLTPVRYGSAEGLLLGGNLTLLARLTGTPYLPDLRGAILYFEEIGEESYRLDGLLAQLSLSGALDAVAGVVVGAITDSEPRHSRPTQSVNEVLDHHLSRLSCPVATGLAFGHIRRKVAVPFGIRARLSVEPGSATLDVIESVTSVRQTA